jgi:hypothetical protein
VKFAATAKKHMQAMIPPLVTLTTDKIDPEVLASLETKLKMSGGHLKPILGTIESTTALDDHWAAVDSAAGTDMSAITVTQPYPANGEPGQVLAVDEEGKPEWITLNLDLPTPEKQITVVEALNALTASGVHIGHIDVSQAYHPGELPQVNLTMTLHTQTHKMGALISDIHEWAALKGGHHA